MNKKVAILTSGGDAPGMNNFIYELTRLLSQDNVFVVEEGYKGLVKNNIKKADIDLFEERRFNGGTIIYSARYPEFKDKEVRQKAASNLKQREIEYLVVVGGDGSITGADLLSEEGIKVIGVPATIDNDIFGTELTIGFQTALETISNALGNIKDTSESHGRISIVEVMGRECGDLAVNSSLGAQVDLISIPENKITEQELIEKSIELRNNKRSVLVVVTEGMYDVHNLAKQIEEKSGFESRATVLGHIQRGGWASESEMQLTKAFAEKTTELLKENKTNLYLVSDLELNIEALPIDQITKPKENTTTLSNLELFERLNGR